MAKAKKATVAEVEVQQPDEQGKMIINHMPVTIRSVDRSRKDITDWWNAVQSAESTYYPNRSDLYDIYNTVRVDAFLSGIIEKRISAVLNKHITFQRDKKKADEFDALINSKYFRLMLRELMEQKMWGLTGFEFIPGEQFAFNIIPRKHIKLETQTIAAEQYDYKGSSYKGVWNIWVLGDREDLGLLLSCTPLALWKKGNMGDWAQFVEIFGQPFIIFTYDAHDKKTKEELDTIMRNIGSGTKLQVPKQVQLTLQDGKSSNGNGDLQDKLRNACNQEMSVKILGATETTTSSNSSGYAQSKEHGKQQDEIIRSDMQDILQALNSEWFLQIVRSYGYNTEGGAFTFEKEVDLAEVKGRLEIVLMVKEVQPVDDDYIYELTGIPKPKKYEQMKKEMQEVKPSPPAPQNPGPVRPGKKGKQKTDDEEDDDSLSTTTNENKIIKWLSGFFAEARK